MGVPDEGDRKRDREIETSSSVRGRQSSSCATITGFSGLILRNWKFVWSNNSLSDNGSDLAHREEGNFSWNPIVSCDPTNPTTHCQNCTPSLAAKRFSMFLILRIEVWGCRLCPRETLFSRFNWPRCLSFKREYRFHVSFVLLPES